MARFLFLVPRIILRRLACLGEISFADMSAVAASAFEGVWGSFLPLIASSIGTIVLTASSIGIVALIASSYVLRGKVALIASFYLFRLKDFL